MECPYKRNVVTLLGSNNLVEKVSSESVSVSLLGVRCDQKPMPNCNGRDMLTGHGLIVRIESSRSYYDESEFKERL